MNESVRQQLLDLGRLVLLLAGHLSGLLLEKRCQQTAKERKNGLASLLRNERNKKEATTGATARRYLGSRLM